MTAAPAPDSAAGGWILPEQLLTADEVAGILRATSARAVHRLRVAGKLPGVRVGRCWHYHRQDVESYVNIQRFGVQDNEQNE